MNWALYGIRSTQNTSIYIYIYIYILSLTERKWLLDILFTLLLYNKVQILYNTKSGICFLLSVLLTPCFEVPALEALTWCHLKGFFYLLKGKVYYSTQLTMKCPHWRGWLSVRRICLLGEKQVFVVRINGCEFTENIKAFPRDKESCPCP